MWITAALFSSFFAGITAILAKCGIKETDSDIATALRTIIVLFFSWAVASAAGSIPTITAISIRSLLFLILSGLATGASWLCYFKALSTGDIHKVAAIDRSSTVLVVLSSMVLFHETGHLAVRLTGAAVLTAGIYLMIEIRPGTPPSRNRRWIIYAILSALFAALTSILARMCITGVESNLPTPIRTCVVLIMAWLVVLLKKGWKNTKGELSRQNRKELLFILLSGITTGSSWLCYYYAIQNGIVSIVVPIDKLSVIVTIIFSFMLFGEKLSKRALAGLLMMICGTLVMIQADLL